MGEAYYGKPDAHLESASGIWLLNCSVCLGEVGLAWQDRDSGTVVSMCWECGTKAQEEASD